MKLIKIVLSVILYICVYLFFLALSLLSLPSQPSGSLMAQISAFLGILFPLTFPFIIWNFRGRHEGKLDDAKGFLEKVSVCGPLIKFFSGYVIGYLAMDLIIGHWPDVKKEYPWTVWVLWQGASFLLGSIWIDFGSKKFVLFGRRWLRPKARKKNIERAENLMAISRLSNQAEHSDHPYELMEVPLPYPDKLKPSDIVPLYKSVIRRAMELGEAPPESTQNIFKDMFGIVCAPGERFLFVFRSKDISIRENRISSRTETVGAGVPGPFGMGFGTGVSKTSEKEELRTSSYGPGMVALTTNNLYFQQNDIWQKVSRDCIISCKDSIGGVDITVSEPSGNSKLIQVEFFDFEVSEMFDKFLKGQK